MSKIPEIVTNRVLSAIEESIASGTSLPWVKSWRNSGVGTPFNPSTKTEYRGINFLILSLLNGVDSQFLTFNQVKKLGGSIKKGAQSNPVVFFNMIDKKADKTEESTDTPEKLTKIPMMRYYSVFNVVDVEGIEFGKPEPREIFINDFAEAIIRNSEIPVLHQGSQPCYKPSKHEINVPGRGFFVTDDAYYSTLFHELVHGTKPALNRKVGEGKEGYAFEELVAELGASMLCAHAGIDCFETDHTAAYIQSWLKALNNDKTYIIKAAQQAQKAVDYLLGKTFEEPTVVLADESPALPIAA